MIGTGFWFRMAMSCMYSYFSQCTIHVQLFHFNVSDMEQVLQFFHQLLSSRKTQHLRELPTAISCLDSFSSCLGLVVYF